MDTWRCSACGASNTPLDRLCSGCRAARPAGFTKIYKAVDPPTDAGKSVSVPTEIKLPVFLADVRFTTGPNWTHGAMHIRQEGLFLLSDQDGLADPEKAATRKAPPGDEAVAAGMSQWYPAKSIDKVLHNPLTGFCIVSKGKKTAIRLTNEGWGQLGAWCRMHGIEF